jgi:ribosomal protein L11 methyltransferase
MPAPDSYRDCRRHIISRFYFCKMNHIQVTIPTTDTELQEMIIAMLAEIGYDGFEENEEQLKAFIDEEKFDEAILSGITSQLDLSFSKEIIAKQNWNELWESNFSPVIVDDFVGIRAHFHEPLKGVEHEIIITPKMSFGTGHHATTFSVMKLMKGIDFKGKSVFDFGSGTGILAILAEKLGATDILAVDNDAWCIENSIENAANNNCKNIRIELAHDAKTGRQFDVVIANINKNIILDNLKALAADVAINGDIVLSGLLREDEADILAAAAAIGWKHITTLSKDAWIAMHFKQ